MNKLTFTSIGRASGPCGHAHSTILQAERCVETHSKKRQRIWGSLSDRAIVRSDGLTMRLPPDPVAQRVGGNGEW